jgi:hypothetical protein
MVVAVIALIASLTGGAYAAANIADRSITNRMLADNSVWHRNIGSGSVRGTNIARGTITNGNMAANSVWHAQIGTGSVRANNVNESLLTAGGALTGQYPNPQIAHGVVGSAQIANGAVGAAQLAAPPAWNPVGTGGFENGWRNSTVEPNLSSSAKPTAAAFTKDADGVVHLRGQITAGTEGRNPATSTAFTLPAGDQPTGGDLYFPVVTSTVGASPDLGFVGIDTAGHVFVIFGDNQFVSLDSISFRP